jgi:NAD(P)-dependent dehydrogenase (short-subunit alcohol dehydrogenase family)
VTGGGSGLGAATARHLSGLGAKVAALDIDAAAAGKVAAEVGGIGVGCDVTDTSGVEAALDAASELGPIGALVHCAGRGGPVRVLDRDGNPARSSSTPTSSGST